MKTRGSREAPYESTVQGAFDTAKEEIGNLYSEIEEWLSNLEGAGMEHLPKYDEVSEAFEALGEAHDILESLNLSGILNAEDLPIKTIQDTRRKAQSRAGRAGNALILLYEAMDTLTDHSEDETQSEETQDLAQEAAEEIRTAIDHLEGVEFPGTF